MLQIMTRRFTLYAYAWHNNQKRDPDRAEAALTLIQENIKELKVIQSTVSDM
jgi:hypothetical protein